MTIPTALRGALTVATARSIGGESFLARPTTATREARSNPKLAHAMCNDLRVVDRHEDRSDQRGPAQHGEQGSHSLYQRHNEQRQRRHRDEPAPEGHLFCALGHRFLLAKPGFASVPVHGSRTRRGNGSLAVAAEF
jgi:hypothetical protein